MCIYPGVFAFTGHCTDSNYREHDQIWYHLIDNFTENNFGKRYFTRNPFSFRKKKKLEKTVKSG